jgi:hypothetical protein
MFLANDEFLNILQSSIENKLYKIVNEKFAKEYPQIQLRRELKSDFPINFDNCYILCGSYEIPVPETIKNVYKFMYATEMYKLLENILNKKGE